jgi:hypothetical protein
MGFLAGFAGALSGIGVRSWYLTCVISIFGIACLGKFLTKRFTDAFGWLLHILGSLGGYYLWGRWGLLMGIIVAAFIWRIALPDQKIPTNEYNIMKKWKEIEKILC